MNAIDRSELTDDQYEEMLTELYGTVDICGMTFDSGYALKRLDRVAFDCGKSDYESENQKWECGECDKEYDNEDDAETCCTPECSECGATDKPLHTDGKCPDCHAEEICECGRKTDDCKTSDGEMEHGDKGEGK